MISLSRLRERARVRVIMHTLTSILSLQRRARKSLGQFEIL